MTTIETAVIEHVRSNPGIVFDDIIKDLTRLGHPEEEVRLAVRTLRGKATGIVRNWGRYYIPGDPNSMKFKDQKRNIVRQIEKRIEGIEPGRGGSPERLAELKWVLELLEENWPNEMFERMKDSEQ